MCTIVTRGDEEFNSVGDLKTVWPQLVFYKPESPRPYEDADCLCVVDIEASARLNGAFVEKDSSFGDYEIIEG